VSAETFFIIVNFLIFIVFLVRSYRFSIFSPYFMLVMHLFLAIPVRGGFLYFISPENSLHYEVNFEISSFIVLCGFCYGVFILFEIFNMRFSSASFKNLFFLGSFVDVSRNRFVGFIIFAYVLLFLNMMVNVQAYGGFSSYVSNMQSRVSTVQSSLAYFSITFDLLVVSSIYLLFLALRTKKYTYIVLFLCAIVVLMLILSGGRGNLIQYCISCAFVFWVSKGFPRIKVTQLLIFSGLFIVVATFGLASRQAAQQDISFSVALNGVSENFAGAISGPFAIYDHYRLAEIYESEVGNDYGLFYFQNLLRPIPRSLWKEKPEVLGKQVRQYFWGDSQGGIPPSFFGEFYISFGYFGVPLGVIFLVCLLLYFSSLYRCALNQHEYVVSGSVLIPYFAFNLIRGGVDVGFTRILIYIFCFAIVSYFSGYWTLKVRR
jgi:oligosaccharide repeat unit polymerase